MLFDIRSMILNKEMVLKKKDAGIILHDRLSLRVI